MTSTTEIRIVSVEDLEIVDTLAVLGTHKVVSRFGDVLYRGGFVRCWLYTKFCVPIGWNVVIWRA